MLLEIIENLRSELVQIVAMSDCFIDDEVVRLSQELDQYIALFHKLGFKKETIKLIS
ncbi:aspartyl-phosphate phosphatase Spo0E family protein [Paenibacillus alginolyticus]|uniref:aspartyl-phosphate phosphatase Spo0E family protein n=1 Tax=Paenibacillus alginolyticus TaxID=59839 RepID=UPI000FD7F4D1